MSWFKIYPNFTMFLSPFIEILGDFYEKKCMHLKNEFYKWVKDKIDQFKDKFYPS